MGGPRLREQAGGRLRLRGLRLDPAYRRLPLAESSRAGRGLRVRRAGGAGEVGRGLEDPAEQSDEPGGLGPDREDGSNLALGAHHRRPGPETYLVRRAALVSGEARGVQGGGLHIGVIYEETKRNDTRGEQWKKKK